MIMAGETLVTVVGNLTDDPSLRFQSSGAAVASFTVASTPRAFDKKSGEWRDQEALFLRCSLWRQAAENLCESLTRGTRVIVTGRLKQRSWEDREGQKRTVVELEVEEVGASLKYATVQVNKVGRSKEDQSTRTVDLGYLKDGDDPWSSPSGGQPTDDSKVPF